jgi:hypothetical protein
LNAKLIIRSFERSVLLLDVVQARLLHDRGVADGRGVGHLSARRRKIRNSGILRFLPVTVAGLLILDVAVRNADVVVVVVDGGGRVGSGVGGVLVVNVTSGVDGVGWVHGIKFLIGIRHGVGIECWELRIKGHLVLCTLNGILEKKKKENLACCISTKRAFIPRIRDKEAIGEKVQNLIYLRNLTALSSKGFKKLFQKQSC